MRPLLQLSCADAPRQVGSAHTLTSTAATAICWCTPPQAMWYQDTPGHTAPSIMDAAAWATAMCRCFWQLRHMVPAFVMLPPRQRPLCSWMPGQVTPAHLVSCRRHSRSHLQVQVSGHPLLPLQGRVCGPPLALASSRLGGILVGQLLQTGKQSISTSARTQVRGWPAAASSRLSSRRAQLQGLDWSACSAELKGGMPRAWTDLTWHEPLNKHMAKAMEIVWQCHIQQV